MNYLFEEYGRRMYTYLRYHCSSPEEAEDLTGDVFEQALRSFGSYDPTKGSVSSWLYGIARHRLARHRLTSKHDSNRREYVEEKVIAKTLTPEEKAVLSERQLMVIEGMKQLPGQIRDAVAMRFMAGLTNSEISKITGISPAHVAVRVHRGLRALRKKFRSEENDEGIQGGSGR